MVTENLSKKRLLITIICLIFQHAEKILERRWEKMLQVQLMFNVRTQSLLTQGH